MNTIHSSAIIEENVEIGKQTKIWHFVHVRNNALIGNNCNIGKSVYIDQSVKIGNKVKIQNFVSVYEGVTIEDDVFIGPAVTFTNDRYPRSNIWNQGKISSTLVKKGASIGANTTIICGITIGEHSMIGAGSVLTKDIPDFALAYGNPARIKGVVCFCGKKLVDLAPNFAGEKTFRCSKCKKEVIFKR